MRGDNHWLDKSKHGVRQDWWTWLILRCVDKWFQTESDSVMDQNKCCFFSVDYLPDEEFFYQWAFHPIKNQQIVWVLPAWFCIFNPECFTHSKLHLGCVRWFRTVFLKLHWMVNKWFANYYSDLNKILTFGNVLWCFKHWQITTL